MLPGITEPAQHARLSVSVTGVLSELHVAEGDQVANGAVVAILDNRVAQAELELALAESKRTAKIAQAESELRRANQLLSRLLALESSRAVAESEIEQATSTRDRASAALADAREEALAAQRNLQLAQARLDVHNIYAPFAGQVLQVNGRLGETVTETDTLIEIANLKKLRVELHVPIEWFQRLQIGQQYRLAASSPINREIEATLLAIEPIVNAATQTFRCTFEIDNPANELVAGFAVRLVRPDL